MSLKLREGDLLKIPVSEDVAALGQVVVLQGHGVFLLAVFPLAEPDPAAQIHRRPDLVVSTMNSSVASGHWVVTGHSKISDDIPIPLYVVPVGPTKTHHIQDIHGKILRPASPVEVDMLQAPRSFSPAAVEKAIRAVNGLAPWEQRFESMRPDWEYSAQKILKSAE